jgi:hypothetical protein
VQVVRLPPALTMDSSVDLGGLPYVPRGNYFYVYQNVTNSGYAAGGTYDRICVPSGFTVDGARIYTMDGDSKYYPVASQYVSGDGCNRVAIGEAIYGNMRTVRWFIQADANAPCGIYSLTNAAFFENAGVNTGSNLTTEKVTICRSTLIPYVRRP